MSQREDFYFFFIRTRTIPRDVGYCCYFYCSGGNNSSSSRSSSSGGGSGDDRVQWSTAAAVRREVRFAVNCRSPVVRSGGGSRRRVVLKRSTMHRRGRRSCRLYPPPSMAATTTAAATSRHSPSRRADRAHDDRVSHASVFLRGAKTKTINFHSLPSSGERPSVEG